MLLSQRAGRTACRGKSAPARLHLERRLAAEINEILHDYGMYVIGRMGIPYRDRDVNIISIVLDAPNDVINALAGKIGRVKGVSSKTIYSKI